MVSPSFSFRQNRVGDSWARLRFLAFRWHCSAEWMVCRFDDSANRSDFHDVRNKLGLNKPWQSIERDALRNYVQKRLNGMITIVLLCIIFYVACLACLQDRFLCAPLAPDRLRRRPTVSRSVLQMQGAVCIVSITTSNYSRIFFRLSMYFRFLFRSVRKSPSGVHWSSISVCEWNSLEEAATSFSIMTNQGGPAPWMLSKVKGRLV
jgi:hypothetical protein